MYVIGTNKAHDIILIHHVKTKDEGIRYMEHIHRAYQLAVENKENIIALIYCYADGKIDKEYIEETINNLSEIEYAGIKEIIKAATLSSIISTEDTKETKKEETKEEETFDDYYNYLYLSAITQLNFSKEQFYNSTPSEVKQLLNNNLLIDVPSSSRAIASL